MWLVLFCLEGKGVGVFVFRGFWPFGFEEAGLLVTGHRLALGICLGRRQ